MYRILLLAILTIHSTSSIANCKKLVEELTKTLHPDTKLKKSRLSNCKIWPHDKNKTLVAIVLLSDLQKNRNESIAYDLDIVAIDNVSEKLIAHFYEKNAFIDDGVFIEKVTFDTAPYRLNSKDYAFGLRLHKRNFSKYNYYSGEVLNLYYLRNKEMKLALKGLSVKESYGDWNDNCTGMFRDVKRKVIINQKTTNGFNNLEIKQISTFSELKAFNTDKCEPTIMKTEKQNILLSFNGINYLIPQSCLDVV